MERIKNELGLEAWVDIREIGIMLNVHAFVVYAYLTQIGASYIRDKYGKGYVDGVCITSCFEGLKDYVRSLRNGRKNQVPFKLLAFIDPQAGSQSDWESKCDGLDKVKKEFYVSYLEEVSNWTLLNQIYRVSHYLNGKKTLFLWDRSMKVWRYVEEEKNASDAGDWMKAISFKYKLCNTAFDEDMRMG